MIEIGINKIYKSFGFKNVLNGISLEFMTGDKIAIIGENGCGKSTLLNIITGIELPDSGTISIRKNSMIGYLEQLPKYNEEKTVKEILFDSIQNIIAIENKLHELESNLTDNTITKYINLQEKYISLGGFEIRSKIDKVIAGFKIKHLIDKKYINLSGGEKRIVLLAAMMIKEPNILLLDEPTNHLDIDTLEWFEDYLNNYKGTVILVSHDRYFLDKVATKVVLIERGEAIIFHGNYSYYLKENEQRLERELKEYKDEQKLVEALKKKIKQLEEWGRLAYPVGEQFFRRAENIRKRLERIELKDKPLVKKEIPLSFTYDCRSGKDVISIKNYDLKINNNILIKDININIKYQDRVCIMGSNGVGKTTLIKEIINNNSNIKIGTNIIIGYIPQEIVYTENITILDYARKFYNDDESHLRSALNKFCFYKDNVYKKITKLSGGEKVRLKLFELIYTKANLLILDEPTNHIDITTKEILENALKEYNGTILFISHDRYFINEIATKIIYIKDKKIIEFIGNYSNIKFNNKKN